MGRKGFLVVREDIIDACKTYGFKIQFVLCTLDTNVDLIDKYIKFFTPRGGKRYFLARSGILLGAQLPL